MNFLSVMKFKDIIKIIKMGKKIKLNHIKKTKKIY